MVNDTKKRPEETWWKHNYIKENTTSQYLCKKKTMILSQTDR